MKKCPHCIYLGIASVSGLSYALYQCNRERLWFSRLNSDVALACESIKSVIKKLFGRATDDNERILRQAYLKFASSAQEPIQL